MSRGLPQTLTRSGRAPLEVILERVAQRDTNGYGKSDEERRFLEDLAWVEPLLRAGATDKIDTRAPVSDVADALDRIAETVRSDGPSPTPGS